MQESPTNHQTALSRRELLKALTATGGAVAAAAFLPGKWVKPAVSAGVLPAHAQATCVDVPSVIRASVNYDGPLFVTAYYEDPANLVSSDDLINYSVTSPCSDTPQTGSIPVGQTQWDQQAGSVFFNTSFDYECSQGEICLSITDTSTGCTSPNPYCMQIPGLPPG